MPSAEVIVVVVYNIIYIIQAKIRAFMGHIGAYIPHLWRCYPPWPSPRGLFLIYGPTDGRDDFPIKIQPLKIHFYFLTKIQNKSTISKNFFRKKFKIKKIHSYKNFRSENRITDKIVKLPGSKTCLKSRHYEKIFPENFRV